MLSANVLRPVAPARERVIVLLVATAHLISHFYLLALIPLLPLLKAALHVSYLELGLALTIGNIAGALVQTPMGFLVDRYGPRKLLICALTLHGLAFASLAFFPSYGWLLVVGALAGIGQSVYHPADYDILSAAVAKERVGRAFSYHTFSGYVGAAIAPPLLVGVATHANLTSAFFVASLPGLLCAIGLLFAPFLDERSSAAERVSSGAAPVPLRQILTRRIIGLTVFFAIFNLSTSALQNFSGIALIKLYHIPLSFATAGLTAYLAGVGIGVLGGGYIADLTKRHGQAASIGFCFTAFFTVLLTTVFLGQWYLVAILGAAGFCTGLIYPSRDMMVRDAAPAGAVGRTFGIVTTGFNIGGTIGPIMYGWLLDRDMPREMLLLALAFMILTIIMPLAGEWRSRKDTAGVSATKAATA
jgi:FSR family fosmidomycin resistance protein-like MFS transporter